MRVMEFIVGDRIASAIGASWYLDGATGKVSAFFVVISTLSASVTGTVSLVKLFI